MTKSSKHQRDFLDGQNYESSSRTGDTTSIYSGHGTAHGIPLKKKFGQHFLRERWVIDEICAQVSFNDQLSIFEIGPGDGFLTRGILEQPLARLWSFEIDPDWVTYLQETIQDSRLTIIPENILTVDFARFEPYKPWVLLANLPYQITFPILKLLYQNRALLKQGVIMVQEEVAQKVVAAPGDSTFQSLFFGYYFTWELLSKIPPTAFYPPPKVYSRLLSFKPRYDAPEIPEFDNFWRFVKLCFLQRRRTLRNNLKQTHYDLDRVSEKYLNARAQELSLDDFIQLWKYLT